MAATESIACMRKLRDHVQNGWEQVPVISPTSLSRVYVVWKHFGLETDSAQRKLHNLYAMQAEGRPWRRHNQFEEPSLHEALFDVHMMSVTWRLRESSFETFVRSAEVKEVPSHSRCSTTVNWLTDTYW